MASVTVPGTGSSPIDIPISGNYSLFIAQQIAAVLDNLPGLSVTGTASGTIPPPPGPPPTQLVITGGGGANNTDGYNFVVNDNTSPNSIGGSNVAILSGTVGGSFWVSGNSTVAAGGGDNLIVGASGGTYSLATGDGNDSIYSSGGGTIGGGGGANLLWAGDPTDSQANYFISDGTNDTIVAGAGADTVAAYGSNDLIFGGSGTLLVGAAPNSTISSGTGAETIFGASGDIVFGNNSAGITFVGGAGGSTVFGSTGSTTTIYGGAGSDINFVNVSTPGAIMASYGGNETLTAALSSSNNTLAGGSGTDSLVGGSGNDILWAGTGAETMTGGAGANFFQFVNGSAGGTDVVTDLTSSDVVNLVGYGANAAAAAIASATVSGGSSTIQLSDATKITFLNVASLSTTNIHSS